MGKGSDGRLACANISHGEICEITCEKPYTSRGHYVCDLGRFRSTVANELYPMCIMEGDGFTQYMMKKAVVVSALTISSSGLFENMDTPEVRLAMVAVVANITANEAKTTKMTHVST